ncbi:MAG: hypothetical protein HOP29_11700 [Phycisphaerales bacterium]|nr:hypothetical protein [Phycisphaerales bacterium]
MAKAFRFRLDPWLTVLKAREAVQQRAVAEQVRDVQRREVVLTDVKEQASEAVEATRRMREERRVDAFGHMQVLQWRVHLANRMVREAEALKIAEGALVGARELLVARARDVKVLEKLREKRRAAYQAEVDRRERVEMDEVGVQMYVARRGVGFAEGD